jgi:hypothetical protein
MTIGTLPLGGSRSQAAGRRLAGAGPTSPNADHADELGAGRTLRGADSLAVSVVVSGCSRQFRRSRESGVSAITAGRGVGVDDALVALVGGSGLTGSNGVRILG